MLTEKRHPGAFIVSEAGNSHCRDAITVDENQEFDPGTILGKTAVVAGVTSESAADANNSGNGVLTLDGAAPVRADAKNGRYRIVCIDPDTDAGTFAVYRPDGVEIGRVDAGNTFDGEIKFALADGAQDFAAGDAFSVDVGIERADFKYRALNLAGAAGEDKAAAIAVYGATTGAGESAKIAGTTRGPAQVRLSDLTFPAGITDPQKAQIINQLATLGIITR